jgi:hypothetical protein
MRALKVFAIAIGGLVGLLLIVFGALQTPPGQRAAAGLISSAASGPEGGLDVDGLSGFFPTDLGVGRIALRDREGPWLTVENARLRWSFGSLLSGRLLVDELSALRCSGSHCRISRSRRTKVAAVGCGCRSGSTSGRSRSATFIWPRRWRASTRTGD